MGARERSFSSVLQSPNFYDTSIVGPSPLTSVFWLQRNEPLPFPFGFFLDSLSLSLSSITPSAADESVWECEKVVPAQA